MADPLIRNSHDHTDLTNLFLLKSATEWLEKQNWISSPYGGDNYLEDVIFRIKLLSGQEWNRIFHDNEIMCDPEKMREYFEVLRTIDPNIQKFYEHAVKVNQAQNQNQKESNLQDR